LPDDGNRYEVINGVLYMATVPSSFHQWISKQLMRYVGIPGEDAGLVYAFSAPIGVIMPGCDPVHPDFVLVRVSNASIIRDRRIMGAPDLIVEILSPGTAKYDAQVKLPAYARAGVPEYAIVDPSARTLSLYRLDGMAPPGINRYAAPRVYAEGDTAMFECVPGIAVPVGALFAGAPDTLL
jgi:Uma2 family endonuclease